MTSGVMSSSRQGSRVSSVSSSPPLRVRWSATEKWRISSSSSPKNSRRTGVVAVGGKTSMMPPRTAYSPRLATRSTREYAASLRPRTTSLNEYSSPRTRCTGSSFSMPVTMGWMTARTGAMTTWGRLSASPVMARSTCRRRPTVSERGERRSWGRVSQAGKSAMSAAGR